MNRVDVFERMSGQGVGVFTTLAKASTDYALDDYEAKVNAHPNRRSRPPREYKPSDILRFVGCNLMMGVHRLPNTKLYWKTPHNQPLVTRFVPTYLEYKTMCRDLHYVNTAAIPRSEQAARNQVDSFWKLGDFLQLLSSSFESARIPRPDLTLDEFCVPWKGRHRARCYNKDKPEKFHLKGYGLNEAETGYMLRFFMYQGRDEKRPEGITATVFPVYVLVGEYSTVDVHHKGHFLWADNWFSGFPSVRICQRVGVDYVGTVKVNRCERAFVDTKTVTKNWKKGDYRCVKSVEDDEKNVVHATQWKDNKVVTFLSTVDQKEGRVIRKQTDKKTRTVITQPTIASAYSWGKVGTDRMDQQVAAYYCGRKWKWPVKVIMHIFHISLFNSYVTWLDINKTTRHDETYLQFTITLLDELHKKCCPSQKATSSLTTHTPTTRGRKRQSASSRTTNSMNVKERDRGRKKCKTCGNNTTTWCKECDVYLCIDTIESGKTCWSAFHASLWIQPL